MKKRKWQRIAVVLLSLSTLAFYAYSRWSGSRGNHSREELLARMPAAASAVLYADLAELRASPFLKEIYAWAPRPQIDADYAQFLRDTGFDYERDLDRVTIGVMKQGADSAFIVVAEGRFDQKKIAAYATRSGTRETRGGREIFSVPVNATSRRISFTFLREGRIAMTDDARLAARLTAPNDNADSLEWRERFRRLAGTAIFAVIRQDAGAGDALARQAPGGLRSPQLAVLLDQLQWIIIAGKPQGDGLRVVAEGECASDQTVRQLTDFLNGLIVLAQAGLQHAKTRKQLDPQAREAYLQLLKNADVSRLDRGETKSVRLVFEVTPQLLELARSPALLPPAAVETPPEKALPNKSVTHK